MSNSTAPNLTLILSTEPPRAANPRLDLIRGRVRTLSEEILQADASDDTALQEKADALATLCLELLRRVGR